MRGLNSVLPGAGRTFHVTADEIEPGVLVRARGDSWYVNPNDATADDDRSEADNGKSWDHPWATMGAALAAASSGDLIYFTGNITEELAGSNLLEDITIVGVANRPRHADHARDAATYAFTKGYGGASWREAASHAASTPLIKVRGQGWRFVNVLFDAPSDAACVYLERNALSDVHEYDASHASFSGVRFVGGQSGIEDSGGQFNVHVVDCIFQALTNGIKTLNTGVAIPLQWCVEYNTFVGNTNDIVMSSTNGVFERNRFLSIAATIVIDLIALSAQGATNMVIHNYFPNLNGDIKNDDGYRGSATDYWRNFGKGTAAEVVESPPGAS